MSRAFPCAGMRKIPQLRLKLIQAVRRATIARLVMTLPARWRACSGETSEIERRFSVPLH